VRIRVILASAFTAAVLPTLFAAPALAQGYGGGTLTIDDPTLGAGDTFHVDGTGCPADAPVTVAIGDEATGTATADAGGAFGHTGTVPAGTAAGRHALTATCGDLVQTLQLTVPDGTTGGTATATPQPGTSPADPAAGDGDLPWTGTDIWPLLRGALALVLAGAGLLLLARHRRAAGRPA
jgi:hypothetical protein